MSGSSFLTANQIRRLPVYLLLDCSTSMENEPIQAVNDGLRLIHEELLKEPRAVETVWLCIIAFASNAEVLFPLEKAVRYVPQTVYANGWTAMGAAFNLLADSIEKDLRPNTQERRGDFRPIVYLLTDGKPTDKYEDAVKRLHNLKENKVPMIIALGCGPDADLGMLHQVTTNVFKMEFVSGDTIKKFFQWISGSITQTARAISSNAGQATRLNDPTDIPGIYYDPEQPR
jgi:uncharacterized protein YegL